MENFVRAIIENLVFNKDAVKIKYREKDNSVNIDIFVDSKDKGRVIGKNGKTANAIRTLIKTAGSESRKKYFVKILEINANRD